MGGGLIFTYFCVKYVSSTQTRSFVLLVHLFGSLLDQLQNNVWNCSVQRRFSSPVRCVICSLFYQSAVTQTMSQASTAKRAKEKFQSSTLTPFAFGLSLFDPFLAPTFELFFFFFSLLTSFVVCSLLIAIMLCALLPAAPSLCVSGFQRKKNGREHLQPWDFHCSYFTVRTWGTFLRFKG